MQNVSVARRYARALLDAVGPSADEVLRQLEGLVTFFDEQDELFAVLSSPALPKQQRLSVLNAVMTGSGLHPLLINALRLLSDRNHLPAVPMVTRIFRDLVDVRMGRLRGTVTSATRLDASQLEGIRTSLAAMTQRDVVLEAIIDKSLLGGVVAQVGSKTYDGSLKSQLQVLGQKLARDVQR